eukprot:222036_1
MEAEDQSIEFHHPHTSYGTQLFCIIGGCAFFLFMGFFVVADFEYWWFMFFWILSVIMVSIGIYLVGKTKIIFDKERNKIFYYQTRCCFLCGKNIYMGKFSEFKGTKIKSRWDANGENREYRIVFEFEGGQTYPGSWSNTNGAKSKLETFQKEINEWYSESHVICSN